MKTLFDTYLEAADEAERLVRKFGRPIGLEKVPASIGSRKQKFKLRFLPKKSMRFGIDAWIEAFEPAEPGRFEQSGD